MKLLGVEKWGVMIEFNWKRNAQYNNTLALLVSGGGMIIFLFSVVSHRSKSLIDELDPHDHAANII